MIPKRPHALRPRRAGDSRSTSRGNPAKGVGILLSGLVLSLAFGVLASCGGDDGSPTTPDPDPPTPPAPNVPPVARVSVSADAGTAPFTVTFDGRASSDADGTIVSYAWTFGDGSTGTGSQVTHTYDEVGFYPVRLTVRDDRGDEATAGDSIWVSSPPGAGTNSIQGVVWLDRNLDGARGAGEDPLAGFAVFLDQDDDRSLDAGEPVAFTGPDGRYVFSGLDAGMSYTVTQALPFGWSNTTPGTGAPVGPSPSPAGSSGFPVVGRDAELGPGQPGPALSVARIVGGEDTPIDPFPFQVALMIGDFQFCGGTLVNSEYVLTAAHCIDDKVPIDVEVLIGTNDLRTGGERVGVEAFRLNPFFNNSLDYDVALLRLNRRLLYPRVYMQTPDQVALSAPGELATVVGWGQLGDGSAPDILKRVEIPIITNDDCAKTAGAFFGSIGPRTICAGADRLGKGPCFGDSGGPLLVPFRDSWIQVGIVSFGVNVDQCGNIPGAFARVTELYDYITAVARFEESGSVVVDWSTGPVATVDFGNFH